jgi:hypothetical protein
VAIEQRIRSLGVRVLTFPWMRRYIQISPLVHGSVRHTAVASATARATNRAADVAVERVAARRKAKSGPGPGPDAKS